MHYDRYFPLTLHPPQCCDGGRAALCLGERENRSPVFEISERRDCVTTIGKPSSARLLFPLPEGEG